MNPEYYKDSTSGRLLKVGQGEAAYWAFVPHPLPPTLNFNIELIKELSRADRALGELAGSGRTMSNPQLLIRPFVRREAVLSSRIEGTQADITELYAYEAGPLFLAGLKTSVPEADVKEVLNYVHALEYGLERLNTLPISLRLMKELHERLMEGVRGERATPGEFRRSQNWIGRPGSNLNEAAYVPPPAPEMLDALGDLEKYIHRHPEDYPLLVRVGLIHYQFEAIHPFLDGNGRIGRLLITLLLIHWNLLPEPLLYLSAFFEQHRQEYYYHLRAISERGAWEEWLIFFLQGVTETAQDASQRAKRLQDLKITWQEYLQELNATGLSFKVLDSLFRSPVTSSSHIQRDFAVSHTAANKLLQRLVDMEVLKEDSSKKRNKLYVAEAILKVLE